MQTKPKPPAPPMTDTPKKRADLAYVAEALRATQPGADEPEDDEDEETEDAPQEAAQAGAGAPASPPADEDGPPPWFHMPKQGFPPDVEPGTTVIFCRFPVWVTGAPAKGERQCAIRPLTAKLEKLAQAKGKGDGYVLAAEYAKAMLCVVDGQPAEQFRAGPGSVNHFWNEIGPKGREALLIQFNKLHRFSSSERDDFLANCVAVRTVG